jgi:hypothetical protein
VQAYILSANVGKYTTTTTYEETLSLFGYGTRHHWRSFDFGEHRSVVSNSDERSKRGAGEKWRIRC